MVWQNVEGHGMVWYSMKRHGMADCIGPWYGGMAECGGPWYGIGILWRGMVWQIVARAMVWAYGRLWRVSEVTVY